MRHSIRSNTPDDFRPRMSLPQPLRVPTADGSDRKRERAVLVAVLVPNTSADLRDPLGELAALADSAGTVVVDSIVQKRTSLSPSYALGKGKLAELVERVEAHEADVVIFDNDLTPRQIRGIEKAINRKVIDRAELILDIFASRAKTRESQLQVELAQLQYSAPRLRGLWTHLERIAGAAGATAAGAVGGVGTRGPGERQIEIDRRIVQKRIGHLKKEIEGIDRRKLREATSRGDQFTVSLVGYTNSGKTTLLNTLTEAGCFVADLLFATLDTKTVRWRVGEGCSVLLSDTVGFIRDLPHHLVASFRATLEEAIHADLLLHVVDASAPNAFRQIEAVDGVLEELGCGNARQLLLLNKIDQCDPTPLLDLLAYRKEEILSISAKTSEGLDNLVQSVTDSYLGDTAEVTLLIPHSGGKLISELDRLADVRGRRYESHGAELDIRMNRTQLKHLLGRHPAVTILKGDVDPVDDDPLEFTS